jgi:LPXTG-motif cell wall-anchored protein
MQAVASFWQWVGFVGGLLILALAIGWIWWRRRNRGAGLYVTGPTQGTPPTPPRRPNGEDRRH